MPPRSRGALVIDYLESDNTSRDHAHHVLKNGNEYQGFTLVFGTVNDLYYCSNRSKRSEQIKPGIHGLSNHLFNEGSRKVRKGTESLHKLLSGPDSIYAEELFLLLQDRTLERQSKITVVKESQSPIFIKGQEFGTRCSTVILIDKDGKVLFSERTFLPEGTPEKTVEYEFVYRR
ncbi:MAG: NRDE family protein [Nitrospiraceae bacterium]|nr:MAG: NRDE family protein [Nitrospiraceae bacterium]